MTYEPHFNCELSLEMPKSPAELAISNLPHFDKPETKQFSFPLRALMESSSRKSPNLSPTLSVSVLSLKSGKNTLFAAIFNTQIGGQELLDLCKELSPMPKHADIVGVAADWDMPIRARTEHESSKNNGILRYHEKTFPEQWKTLMLSIEAMHQTIAAETPFYRSSVLPRLSKKELSEYTNPIPNLVKETGNHIKAMDKIIGIIGGGESYNLLKNFLNLSEPKIDQQLLEDVFYLLDNETQEKIRKSVIELRYLPLGNPESPSYVHRSIHGLDEGKIVNDTEGCFSSDFIVYTDKHGRVIKSRIPGSETQISKKPKIIPVLSWINTKGKRQLAHQKSISLEVNGRQIYIDNMVGYMCLAAMIGKKELGFEADHKKRPMGPAQVPLLTLFEGYRSKILGSSIIASLEY